MQRWIFALMLMLSGSVLAFQDPYGVYNMMNYLTNVESVGKLTKQIDQAKEQYDELKKNYKIVKDNWDTAIGIHQQGLKHLTKIDAQKVKDLKDMLKKMRGKLDEINQLEKERQKLDEEYEAHFQVPGDKTRPNSAESEAVQARIQATLKANRRAIDSLTLVETHIETGNQQVDGFLDDSNNAEGTLQAAQSTNNILAVMAQHEQDMKQLMARDLNQRTLAMSQEHIDKTFAYNVNKAFYKSKEAEKPERKNLAALRRELPKLKGDKHG